MRQVGGDGVKEMLPVGGRPMIRRAVEEAEASGIERICIVLRHGKEAIREHFEAEPPQRAELTFVWQQEPRGAGDALLAARSVVGEETFAMILPDQLLRSARPAVRQLMDHWRPGSILWSAIVRLDPGDLPFFPGARRPGIAGRDGDLFVLRGFETDPEKGAADPGLRAFGRTIFPPEVFACLGEEYRDPRSGEVDLGPTVAVLETKVDHRGVLLEGEPIDCGTSEGWLRWGRS